MRYLCLYRAAAGEEGGLPDPEHMAAMGRLVRRLKRHKPSFGKTGQSLSG